MKTETLNDDRAIQVILKRFHDLENIWDNPRRRVQGLLELRSILETLHSSKDLDIPRITRIHSHINENISLEHLWNLMVPVEREYSKTNITDGDFLLDTKDKPCDHPASAMPACVILDNIRSSFNVGGIFRTSECTGFEKIYLCGYSPSPENEKVQQSSMGTHESVSWEKRHDIKDLIDELRRESIQTVALETVPGAPTPTEAEISFPCAILLGNERFGLGKKTLSQTDIAVNIPVYGRKNSLNVVSAFTICAYEIRKKWEASRKDP